MKHQQHHLPVTTTISRMLSSFIFTVLIVSSINNEQSNHHFVHGFTSTTTTTTKQPTTTSSSSSSSSLSLYPSVVVNNKNNFLSIRPTTQQDCRRPYGCYATTKQKEKVEVDTKHIGHGDVDVDAVVDVEFINGDPTGSSMMKNHTTKTTTTMKSATEAATEIANSMMTGDFNQSAQMIELMDEISRRINEGSIELVQNITTVVDEQMSQLPDSNAQELAEYIGDLAISIQKAQQEEVERQLEELEKVFVQPLERVAFSDAPLFDIDSKPVANKTKVVDPAQKEIDEERRKLVFYGINSTLTKSARMRTGEIFRNFNVAPLYYSVTLLYRWLKKASVRVIMFVYDSSFWPQRLTKHSIPSLLPCCSTPPFILYRHTKVWRML